MTLLRPRVLLTAAACLLFAAVTSGARAQSNAAPDSLYVLTPASGYEDGCFDPCLCPVHLTDGLGGTFRLRPAPAEPGYTVYTIDQVNWFLPQFDQRITGSGTYRIGGEFARTHRLTLDLLQDGRPLQHFDSGLVLGGDTFPAITISISMNNYVCHDTVFHVAAAPVNPKLTPYGLFGSKYLEGCFGPCDCAVVSKLLTGRFGLLRLGSHTGTAGGGVDYAVLDVRWLVRSASTSPVNDAYPVGGFGIYRTRPGGGVTTVMPSHRMTLFLSENGAPEVRFDSGIVPGGENGPGGAPPKSIDVDLAADGFACTDRVYSVRSRRGNAAIMDFGAITADPAPIPVTPVP